MIIILITLTRAVARIRRRLVTLGLRYGLYMYSIGRRILIRLLVPLFLLLRDLRYV